MITLPPNFTHQRLPYGLSAIKGGQSHGPPLILLPGWPQTLSAYIPILSNLSSTFSIWAIDLPGTGGSAPPPPPQPSSSSETVPSTDGYDTSNISTLIASALTSTLGPNTKYHLVGHDVGAWVAFALATQHPSSVQTLTLFDSAVPGLQSPPPPSFPLPPHLNTKLWQFSFNRLPAGLPELLVQGKEREFLDWFFDNKARYPERITPESRAEYARHYAKPDGAMARGFAYYRAWDVSREQNLRWVSGGGGGGGRPEGNDDNDNDDNGKERPHHGQKLAMPLLALGGSHGVGGGLKASMEAVTMVEECLDDDDDDDGVIADCGHYVMEEQPEEVCRRLRAFLLRY